MNTKDKLLHIAAQCEQLHRELEMIGRPVNEGGAADISFAASHQIGVAMSNLLYTASKLVRLAGDLQTNKL